jgi:succinoglycan biosynthesis protein ExoM
MTTLAVAVPTFKRPRSLARLLECLAPIPVAFRVVVADNDAEGAEGLAVAQACAANGYPRPLEAMVVAERGIAQTRNALAAHVVADARLKFVAMIDDDESPAPGWLGALLRTQAATGAHVVGGPVRRRFEINVPRHLETANSYAPGRFRTGPIDFVDATSNVLFDVDVFRQSAPPWFDPFFALTGGEDKDFMMRLKLGGRRFAWADDASVEETLPATRCTTSWAVQRAFSAGNSDMLVNLRRRPPGFNAVSETAKIAGAAGLALFNLTLLGFDPARRFDGLRLGARALGKIAAALGHRHLEYRTIHGA